MNSKLLSGHTIYHLDATASASSAGHGCSEVSDGREAAAIAAAIILQHPEFDGARATRDYMLAGARRWLNLGVESYTCRRWYT